MFSVCLLGLIKVSVTQQSQFISLSIQDTMEYIAVVICFGQYDSTWMQLVF